MKNKKTKTGTSTSMFSNTRNLWLVVFIFPFILYWNTTYNKYSLDDHLVIEQNEQVQKGFRGIGEILTEPYALEEGLSYGYRPVVKLSYAIEYGIFGENPGINHLFSVLFFALAMVVLFLVLKRLFQNSNPLFPLIIVLLYAANPLHTEIVASLKNRDEIFMLLFAFLALYQSLKYVDTGKHIRLLYTSLFFLLALLSKSTAIPFIIIIPLTLYYFTDNKKSTLFVSGVLVIIFLISFLVPKLILPEDIRPVLFYENPLFFEDSLNVRVGTAANIMLFYLKLIIFPHPLLCYYGYNTIPLTGITSPLAILSVIIHIFLLVVAIKGWGRKTLLSYGIFVYLIGIVLYSNIIVPAPGIVADRFAIVALLGFSLLTAAIIFYIAKTPRETASIPWKRSRIILGLTILLLIPYAVKTFTRNKDWRTYISLYENDIHYLENSVKMNMLYAQALTSRLYYNNQLGVNLSDNERYIELIQKHYKQALNLYPGNYEVLNNFGTFYSYNLNQYEKAIPWLEKAIELNSEKPEAYFNLGYAYHMLNKTSEAIQQYNNALKVKPEYKEVKMALGDLYFKNGNIKKAIDINKEIIKSDSLNIQAYTNIGNYYIFNSDTLSAMRFWEEAVQVYPHKQLLINLSYLHKQYGNDKKSIYYYKQSEKVK